MQQPWNVRAVIAAIAMLVMPWLLHAQQAHIRATHLGVGTPDMDVYIASDTASFYGLMPGSASGVSNLAPSTVRVRVTEHNIPSPIYFDQNITLQNNRRVNLLIFGTPGNYEFETLNLALNSTVPGDSAHVRFVNAAPDVANVDIRIRDSYGKTLNLNTLAYKSNTSFQSLSRGTADIEVYAAGTQNRLLRVRHDFSSGARNTIFLTGLASSGVGLRLQLQNEITLSAQQPLRPLLAPSARIRVVHAVPDGPAVDIYSGNSLVVSEASFRDASALMPIGSGAQTLGITVAGQPLGSSIINLNLTPNEDSVYTVVAVGALATPPSALVFSRPALLSVSNDSVLVRVVHAAPNAGNVDIRVEHTGGTPLTMNNVAFRSVSGYTRLPSGAVTVHVGATGSTPNFTASGTLEGGGIYTLFATGASGDDFQLNLLNDTRTDAQSPIPALTAAAKGALRAVHLVPDAPEVDIFLNDNGNAPTSLGFRQAGAISEELNAGPANVKIGLKGTGIGAAIVNRDITIVGETLLTAFAVGSVSTASLDVITLPTTAADVPQQGQASIRFLHASPDGGPVDIELTAASGQPQRFSNISFKGNTSYVIVPAGTATVKIFPVGGQTPVLTAQGNIPADAIATAIIGGTITTGNIGVNLLIDTDEGGQRPMILFAEVPTTSVPFDRTAAGTMTIAPNPASGMAQIGYSLDRAGSVRLALYNQLGELVAVSEPGTQEKGDHAMTVSTMMLPAGLYNAVITGDDGAHIGTGKLVVVK